MNTTIIGSQLGDEGKGRIVDRFSDRADVVVRYQGGNNAGHTVVADGAEYTLRLLPSGVIRGATGVLGNGCVIDLETLFAEIDDCRERGLEPDVRVSGRAHVVLPSHVDGDAAAEARKGESGLAIGTTGNGIGPAYEDKAGRRGIRIADLLAPAVLRERLEHLFDYHRTHGGDSPSSEDGREPVDELCSTLLAYGERLEQAGMLADVGPFLTERHRDGATILFEGAQGTLLDVDHGNYPYVTSSNPTTGGAIAGTGVSPRVVADGEIVGVVKSYVTRVGRGALPTEMDEAVATAIRERAGEFGSVTGRPRRIGWLDLPTLRHAARVNGYTGLALNHVDVLAELDEIKVCERYAFQGSTRETIPPQSAAWAACEPRYRRFDSWPDRDWSGVAEAGYDALPAEAKRYVEYVSDALDLPIYTIGLGPNRDDVIELVDPLDSERTGSRRPADTSI